MSFTTGTNCWCVSYLFCLDRVVTFSIVELKIAFASKLIVWIDLWSTFSNVTNILSKFCRIWSLLLLNVTAGMYKSIATISGGWVGLFFLAVFNHFFHSQMVSTGHQNDRKQTITCNKHSSYRFTLHDTIYELMTESLHSCVHNCELQ